MEPSNYDEIQCTLSDVQDYWWNKADGDVQ
jgi:hypothetical protein